MKRALLILTIIFSIVSCDSPEDTHDAKNITSNNVVEIIDYQFLFDEKEFPSTEYNEILNELQICDSVNVEGSNCATCSPEFFKILPLKEEKNIKDAFLLQIKALTVLKGQSAKLPMRHLIVFEREKGELVKVNGFRGKLIAKRTSKEGVDDLIVRFYIPDEQAFFNCLFIWNGAKYRFQSVEAIDGNGGNGSVIESMKDGLSKEVYQILMHNTMLF